MDGWSIHLMKICQETKWGQFSKMRDTNVPKRIVAKYKIMSIFLD